MVEVFTKNKEVERKKRWLRGCAFLNCTLAVVFLAAAIAIPIVVQNAFQNGVRDNILLFDGDQDAFDTWLDTSVKGQWYTVYIFNVTNPQEYADGGDLHVEPIGPFIYDSVRRRINVTYEQDNTVVSYNPWQQAEFRRDASIADESLELTVIDPVYATVVELFGGTGFMPNLYPNYEDLTDVERLFTRKNVSEIVFGYLDPVLEPLAPFGAPDGYPGIIQVKNETEALSSPRDAMTTGVNDIENAREYVMFEGRDIYEQKIGVGAIEPIWATDEANKVAGKDVYQFSSDIQEGDTLHLFIEPMRRVVPFKFSGETVEYFGVETWRMVIDQENAFTPAYWNAENETGYLFNVSRAYFGGPNFLFNPMMLDAPEGTDNKIVGLTPDKTLHESFFDVEPKSGATLNARVGFQLNLRISGPFEFDKTDPDNDLMWHTNIEEGYAPLFWTQLQGEVNQDDADMLRSNFSLVDGLTLGSQIAGYTLFALCLLLVIYLWRKNKQLQRQTAINARNRLLGDLVDD